MWQWYQRARKDGSIGAMKVMEYRVKNSFGISRVTLWRRIQGVKDGRYNLKQHGPLLVDRRRTCHIPRLTPEDREKLKLLVSVALTP